MQTNIIIDNQEFTVTITPEAGMWYVELPDILVKKYNLSVSFVIRNLNGVLDSQITSYGIHGLSLFEQLSDFIRNEPGNEIAPL